MTAIFSALASLAWIALTFSKGASVNMDLWFTAIYAATPLIALWALSWLLSFLL